MPDEVEAIEVLIAEHPGGISWPDLERAYAERCGRSINYGTLLRHLDSLIGERRVLATGERTQSRYGIRINRFEG
jgi:hypothetical protein